jgi:molecular chaperone DnaK (HSP70)
VNVRESNAQNTISEFKMLIGRKLGDPDVVEYLNYTSTKLKENQNGEICAEVMYNNELNQIPIRIATSYFFTKLKEVASFAIENNKNPLTPMEGVISCPSFFDQQQRTILFEAASIAGINCYNVVSDLAAISMDYGFPKTDLPADNPINVVFVLVGHSYSRFVFVVIYLFIYFFYTIIFI